MTEKLSNHLLNLKTNFMRTKNYLLTIGLLLTFCQGCIKELHELPPRPSITVKLNGAERDSIIIRPGEKVNVELEFTANEGILREVYIKDMAGAYITGFPLNLDSASFQNKTSHSYSLVANDYMPDGGSHYQVYSFQAVCQDNNQPKQLINKNITILVADELTNYTVILGAQANKEHGCFLNISTGEVYTVEQAQKMSINELKQIELCYFYGEDDIVASYHREQRFYMLLSDYYISTNWNSLTNGYEELAPYRIPLLEQAKPEEGDSYCTIKFPEYTANIAVETFDTFKFTTDLLSYRNPSYTDFSAPQVYGIYMISSRRYANWPEDEKAKEFRTSVIRVKEIVPGEAGYIVLDIKTSAEYIY